MAYLIMLLEAHIIQVLLIIFKFKKCRFTYMWSLCLAQLREMGRRRNRITLLSWITFPTWAVLRVKFHVLFEIDLRKQWLAYWRPMTICQLMNKNYRKSLAFFKLTVMMKRVTEEKVTFHELTSCKTAYGVCTNSKIHSKMLSVKDGQMWEAKGWEATKGRQYLK